ncbi:MULTISPECIES: hypothetical protein [Streptomyces]|uniref:hypothetical protein n=1 Tax=Streptomyces TaxID=1883 RepID=UPI000AC94255|nr:hypothetical protein [Streptomyces hirsutus]WTD73043.1 hypothetical protein OHB56_03230 [Streptomyces sp. NBC_01635]
MAVRTLDRAARPLPRLTSRRHIDFGRTSSAICRRSAPQHSPSGQPDFGPSDSGRSVSGPSASRHA